MIFNRCNPTEEKITQRCATTEALEQDIKADSSIVEKIQEVEGALQRKLSDRSLSALTSTITIPVVVHVVYNTAEQNISDAQVLSQIAVLNQDFARTNSDASNTPIPFLPVASSGAKIQFCLAKRDIAGKATDGIIRKPTTVTSWSSNGAVKLSRLGGDDAWDNSQYLNIWVCNLTAGILGYATYPGYNPIADGIVIRYKAFGTIGVLLPGFHLGRTAVHEAAHWLNVYHIWGDAQCGDDKVADTPPQYYSNYNCPAFPHVTNCSGNAPNGDMFMNYMDYTPDNCMNIFTVGQMARMTATLATSRLSIQTSKGCLPPDTIAPPPICNVPAGLNSIATSTSVILSWTGNGNSYNVRYRASCSSVWVTVTSPATSIHISGLLLGTTYEYQVQGVCSVGLSGYSVSANFQTGT